MTNLFTQTGVAVSVAILTTVISVEVKAAPIYEHYYVGIDGREILPSGTYAGLTNPNYNRLTFLFPHIEEDSSTNHFHGIGTYSYTGDASNPTIVPTNTNNRLPESYTGMSPITLLPGSGIFNNKFISQATGEEYTNWTIKPIKSLLDYSGDEAADYLYNSSGGRWQGLLGDATIGLELVSITDGLKVADASGVDLFNAVGDIYSIGQGDDFSFTPIFYTDKSANTGKYSATFRLRDLNGTTSLGESGTFNVDFQVTHVPEPSLLLGFGLLAGLGVVKKKRQKQIS